MAVRRLNISLSRIPESSDSKLIELYRQTL